MVDFYSSLSTLVNFYPQGTWLPSLALAGILAVQLGTPVAPGRLLYQPSPEGKVVGRKVPGVSDAYNFEYPFVQYQDLVIPELEYSPLADLPPHL